MTQQLAKQAEGLIPFEAVPLGRKIIVHPVVVDDSDALIARPDLSRENLPELGVVVYVSFDAMRNVYLDLEDYESRIEDAKGRKKTRLQQLFMFEKDHRLIEVGDILALNRFSGMGVPGSLLLAYEPEDLVCKIRGLPVRLKTADERVLESAAMPVSPHQGMATMDVIDPGRRIVAP